MGQHVIESESEQQSYQAQQQVSGFRTICLPLEQFVSVGETVPILRWQLEAATQRIQGAIEVIQQSANHLVLGVPAGIHVVVQANELPE